jgi:hypothetical protein
MSRRSTFFFCTAGRLGRLRRPGRLGRRGALGALAGLLPLAAARAFQIEPASPGVAAMLAARCEDAAAHRRLVQELLERYAGLGAEEAAARVRAMACPICGCSLAAALPPDGPP